jgi:transposase
VSIAGALWWAPWRAWDECPLGLVYQTLVDTYFTNDRSAAFLELLMRDLPDGLTVVWDGGQMHKGDPIRKAVERFRPRLVLERLPAYAPMLNPVEPLWSWLKSSRLCNAAPTDAAELGRFVRRELEPVRNNHGFLRSMWQGSDLPLPRALLI